MEKGLKIGFCKICGHSLRLHAYGLGCGMAQVLDEEEDYCTTCEEQGGDLYDDEEV